MSIVTVVIMSKNILQNKLTEAVKWTVSETAIRKHVGAIDGCSPNMEIDIRPED